MAQGRSHALRRLTAVTDFALHEHLGVARYHVYNALGLERCGEAFWRAVSAGRGRSW